MFRRKTHKIKTFEIHAAFEGRTPRTALVTALDETDAMQTAFADPGKWFHTLQEPEYVAVTVAA